MPDLINARGGVSDRRRLATPALLAGIGVVLLGGPLFVLLWLERFSWLMRPQDTSMTRWSVVADQVDVALAVALLLCGASSVCFSIAGFLAGIARSWALTLTGLLLVVTLCGLCFVVGIDVARLTRDWATVPM